MLKWFLRALFIYHTSQNKMLLKSCNRNRFVKLGSQNQDNLLYFDKNKLHIPTHISSSIRKFLTQTLVKLIHNLFPYYLKLAVFVRHERIILYLPKNVLMSIPILLTCFFFHFRSVRLHQKMGLTASPLRRRGCFLVIGIVVLVPFTMLMLFIGPGKYPLQ